MSTIEGLHCTHMSPELPTHSLQAKTPEDAEEGYYLMQDIMKLMQQQQNADGNPKRGAKAVRVLVPELEEDTFTVGPALFGPDLGENEFQVGFFLNAEEGTQNLEVTYEQHPYIALWWALQKCLAVYKTTRPL